MTAQNEQLLKQFGTVSNQDALSKIGNLSLSNNYLVVVNIPNKVTAYLEESISGQNIPNMPIYCSSASLPGSTFATSEVKDNFMGVTQEFAHTRLYTDIDFTYYIDSKYTSLEVFEKWMDYISGPNTPSDEYKKLELEDLNGTSRSSKNFYRRFKYPDTYKTRMSIYKFERDFEFKTKKRYLVYNFVNAFPKSLSATPVSYGPSELLQVTVTMNYDRYVTYAENFGPTESSTDDDERGGRGLSGEIQQLKILERRNTITPVQQNRLDQLRREFPG